MAWSSRNCWKQGPSIDNVTRKKIWEENYRTRENLKGVQQSEHFWSFQMTRSGCCCASPSFLKKKFGSLQTLDKIECSSHCESHCLGSAIPSNCQIHKSQKEPVHRYHRDAATETFYPRADKSVGPEHKYQVVQLSPPDETPSSQLYKSPTKYCSRYKPPDWERNEPSKSRQYRQQNIQKLRKNEEVLQQTMQRHSHKKPHGKVGNWGTEYTRSFKESSWPKYMTPGPKQVYHSRCGTPMPRDLGNRETSQANHAVG